MFEILDSGIGSGFGGASGTKRELPSVCALAPIQQIYSQAWSDL